MRNPFFSWLHGIVETLYFLPAIVFAGAWIVAPKTLSFWIAALPLYYVCGNVLARFMSGKYRIVRIGIQSLVTLGSAYLVHGLSLAAIVYFLMAYVSVVRGTLTFNQRYAEMLPVNFSMFVILLYFFASVFFRYVPALETYMLWIYVGGLLTFVIMLFMANLEHLEAETRSDRGGKRVNRTLLLYNRVYVVLFLLLTFLVAMFGEIRRMLTRFRDALISRIQRWLSREEEISIVTEVREETGPPPLPFQDEIKEPAAWVRFLETVTMTVMYILLLAGFVVLLIWIIIQLRKAVKRLWEWMVERFTWQAGSDPWDEWGYMDEKTSLIDWQKWRQGAGARWREFRRRFTSEPKWDELPDNREKIRYLYKRWLLRAIESGYPFKAHLTPSETERELEQTFRAPEKMIDAYNAARYGHKIPDEQSLETWRKKL